MDQNNLLSGEGDVKIIVKTRRRHECNNCGEPSTKRFSFCYINGRKNPASSMYGRDDCSYCSDADVYSCDACERDVRRETCPDGMQWAATQTLTDSNALRFMQWVERDATSHEVAAIAKATGAKS